VVVEGELEFVVVVAGKQRKGKALVEVEHQEEVGWEKLESKFVQVEGEFVD